MYRQETNNSKNISTDKLMEELQAGLDSIKTDADWIPEEHARELLDLCEGNK